MFGNCGDTDTAEFRAWLDTKLLNTASAGGNSEYLTTLIDAGADVNVIGQTHRGHGINARGSKRRLQVHQSFTSRLELMWNEEKT